MPRLITGRLDRALEPRNCLVVASKVNQIRADIVVRVAKVRINFDGAPAFLDGLFCLSLEVVRPSREKSCRLLAVGRKDFRANFIELTAACSRWPAI